MQSFNKASNKRKKGFIGEQKAVEYLSNKGYRILEQNSVHHHAEIDLICEDITHQIVFVEVKTRSTIQFGLAIEHISPRKVQLLYRAAELWLYKKNLEHRSCRFDVITIEKQKNRWKVHHFENAFILGI